MPIQRQFMDQSCEMIAKISCEVAFLGGIVDQLQKENQELKDQLQLAKLDEVNPTVSPLKNGKENAQRTSV